MAKPTRVTVTIREATDDLETSTMSFYIASALATIAAIETAAEAVVTSLSAIITGEVIEVHYSYPFDITAWSLLPSSGSDTDKLVSARLILTTDDPFFAQMNFPTFDLDHLGTGKDVDQTEPDVIALLAAIMANSVVTSQDQTITGQSAFYRTFGSKK